MATMARASFDLIQVFLAVDAAKWFGEGGT